MYYLAWIQFAPNSISTHSKHRRTLSVHSNNTFSFRCVCLSKQICVSGRKKLLHLRFSIRSGFYCNLTQHFKEVIMAIVTDHIWVTCNVYCLGFWGCSQAMVGERLRRRKQLGRLPLPPITRCLHVIELEVLWKHFNFSYGHKMRFQEPFTKLAPKTQPNNYAYICRRRDFLDSACGERRSQSSYWCA